MFITCDKISQTLSKCDFESQCVFPCDVVVETKHNSAQRTDEWELSHDENFQILRFDSHSALICY